MPVMTPCSGAVQITRTCGAEGSEGGSEFLTISIDGGGAGGVAFDGLVTGMSLNIAANYQFMHSLDDFIYVYAFGDKIGDLVFNGIGFVNACGPGAARIGIMRLYEYYKNNSSTASGVKILTITLTPGNGESVSLRGVLTAVRIDVVEENGIIGYWSATFKVIRND